MTTTKGSLRVVVVGRGGSIVYSQHSLVVDGLEVDVEPMKITTREPAPRPTIVIVEMTHMEACELRDYCSPDDISLKSNPVPYKFFSLIHHLTQDW